jgi:hypothetical protein
LVLPLPLGLSVCVARPTSGCGYAMALMPAVNTSLNVGRVIAVVPRGTKSPSVCYTERLTLSSWLVVI